MYYLYRFVERMPDGYEQRVRQMLNLPESELYKILAYEQIRQKEEANLAAYAGVKASLM